MQRNIVPLHLSNHHHRTRPHIRGSPFPGILCPPSIPAQSRRGDPEWQAITDGCGDRFGTDAAGETGKEGEKAGTDADDLGNGDVD